MSFIRPYLGNKRQRHCGIMLFTQTLGTITYYKYHMKMKKLIVIFLVFLSVDFNSLAQETSDTLKVLFVGNSYVYVSNIPQLVSLISDSTHTKLLTAKSVVAGAKLSQHWRSERGLRTKELIKIGNFDYVVLQEQSMGTIEQPDSFLIYSKKFSDYIRQNGAQPYFYLTWAREKVPQYQETITNVYNKAAKDNNAGIVPVGESWVLAQKLRPGIELYLDDGSHQSEFGAFLSACVFVKVLTNELPEKLPNVYEILDSKGESVWLTYIEKLDITFCLKVVNKIIE